MVGKTLSQGTETSVGVEKPQSGQKNLSRGRKISVRVGKNLSQGRKTSVGVGRNLSQGRKTSVELEKPQSVPLSHPQLNVERLQGKWYNLLLP